MVDAGDTLDRAGTAIAYRHVPGRLPGLLFLPGYRSDMTGSKASALAAWARDRGQAITLLDYSGHGRSGGRFEDGTIGAWLEDAAAVLDGVAQGPQVLVGSSMGGWIALLLARRRPERVAGLVGIAAAPDFTERLIWDQLTDAQRADLMERGVMVEPSPYDPAGIVYTRALVEEGRRHLLLTAPPVAISAPVRLLHGQQDGDVPWSLSLELAAALATPDVRVTLVKDGDHRLSRPQDIALLLETVQSLLPAPAGNP